MYNEKRGEQDDASLEIPDSVAPDASALQSKEVLS
jgi:hypothetical protein